MPYLNREQTLHHTRALDPDSFLFRTSADLLEATALLEALCRSEGGFERWAKAEAFVADFRRPTQ